MKHNLTRLLLVAFVAGSITLSCSKDDNNTPPAPVDTTEAKAAWGGVMQGNDPDEKTWPDLSENYWFYPMDVAGNANTGLRITGQFPNVDARFFNITVYNDNTMQRITSIEDFNIIPNDNSRNPFNENGVSGSNYFEVNIVPEGSKTSGLKNVLTFPAGMQKISLLLRIYFNSTEHDGSFGGVELPQLTFFDLSSGKDTKAAQRTTSFYYTYFAAFVNAIPTLKAQQAMVFTLAPNTAYGNGPTGYVSAANRITQNNALFFRFIPPTHPSLDDVATNRTADVRYWSICVGDTSTYTPYTIFDRNVVKDGEYVNFMIVTKNDANLAALRIKAQALNINLVEWDIEKHGEPMMVFYRQMYINPDFAYSVLANNASTGITPYPPLNGLGIPDQTLQPYPSNANVAHKVLGQHGPYGIANVPSAMILQPTITSAAFMRQGEDANMPGESN